MKSLWRVLRREGLAEKEKPRKKYKPKPYEQMQRPGQRIQIDVKVVPRLSIADPQLKLYIYTAIDEYSRYRILGTCSSADFLRKVVDAFARKGVKIECLQTDNGLEFTNRFSSGRRDQLTFFEATAAELGIRNNLNLYTPRLMEKWKAATGKTRNTSALATAFTRFPTLVGSSLSTKAAETPVPCDPLPGFRPDNGSHPSLSNMFDKPTPSMKQEHGLHRGDRHLLPLHSRTMAMNGRFSSYQNLRSFWEELTYRLRRCENDSPFGGRT